MPPANMAVPPQNIVLFAVRVDFIGVSCGSVLAAAVAADATLSRSSPATAGAPLTDRVNRAAIPIRSIFMVRVSRSGGPSGPSRSSRMKQVGGPHDPPPAAYQRDLMPNIARRGGTKRRGAPNDDEVPSADATPSLWSLLFRFRMSRKSPTLVELVTAKSFCAGKAIIVPAGTRRSPSLASMLMVGAAGNPRPEILICRE